MFAKKIRFNRGNCVEKYFLRIYNFITNIPLVIIILVIFSIPLIYRSLKSSLSLSLVITCTRGILKQLYCNIIYKFSWKTISQRIVKILINTVKILPFNATNIPNSLAQVTHRQSSRRDKFAKAEFLELTRLASCGSFRVNLTDYYYTITLWLPLHGLTHNLVGRPASKFPSR